jgi:hypothetical protein
MKALLWKDFRINLPVIITGLLLWFAAYAAIGLNVWLQTWPVFPGRGQWSEVIQIASVGGRALLTIVVGVLGANAIASERAERSTEFLFSLPPTRLKILTSKFLVALTTTILLWLGHQFMSDVVSPWLSANGASVNRVPLLGYTGGLVLIFGSTWLGSARLSSPAFALGGGIALCVAVISVLFEISRRVTWPVPDLVPIGMLVAGITAFLVGSIYYLRRIEP